jgi:hypothetical protein
MATRRTVATVIARWGDQRALLRVHDGPTVEVPVPDAMGERVDVGDEVVVYLEGARPVGWALADERLGAVLGGDT